MTKQEDIVHSDVSGALRVLGHLFFMFVFKRHLECSVQIVKKIKTPL